MVIWQYKVVTVPDYLSEEELNEIGSLGWELVNFHPTVVKNVVYVFKRTFDKK